MPDETTNPSRNWKREFLKWITALVLILPAMIPYFFHFIDSPQNKRDLPLIGFFLKGEPLLPTGFIQFDQAYYFAHSREYFDGGEVHLFFGNPYSEDYSPPRIYFQIYSFLLGLVWKITGGDPGLLYCIFGFLSALVCGRIALGIYEFMVGLEGFPQKLGLVFFFWGGGVMVLAGLLYTGSLSPLKFFSLDPGWGGWCLNFGRTLVYPVEAFYHALFLGTVLALLKKRWNLACLLAFSLSISHPFSGVELLVILVGWSALEVLPLKNSSLPKIYGLIFFLLLVFHLGYYMVYLNSFPEHRLVQHQFKEAGKNYFLQINQLLFGYFIVAFFAFLSLRRASLVRKYFSDYRHRFLGIWFLGALFLANHQYFIEPIQPAHFTRGYIWIPLFLIGLPKLIQVLHQGLRKKSSLLMVGLFSFLFLLDNGSWLLCYSKYLTVLHKDRKMSESQWDILQKINRKQDRYYREKILVVTSDHRLANYVVVYTPLRTWVSHEGITPHFRKRIGENIEFFTRGKAPKEWKERNLLMIFERERLEVVAPYLASRKARKIDSNFFYEVYEMKGK